MRTTHELDAAYRRAIELDDLRDERRERRDKERYTMANHKYEDIARRNGWSFNPDTRVFTDTDGQRYMCDDDATIEFKSAEAKRELRVAEEALFKLPGTAEAKHAVLEAFKLAIRRQVEHSLFAAWEQKEVAAGRDNLSFGWFLRDQGYLRDATGEPIENMSRADQEVFERMNGLVDEMRERLRGQNPDPEAIRKAVLAENPGLIDEIAGTERVAKSIEKARLQF